MFQSGRGYGEHVKCESVGILDPDQESGGEVPEAEQLLGETKLFPTRRLSITSSSFPFQPSFSLLPIPYPSPLLSRT